MAITTNPVLTLRRIDGTACYVARDEVEAWNLKQAYETLKKAYGKAVAAKYRLEERDERAKS